MHCFSVQHLGLIIMDVPAFIFATFGSNHSPFHHGFPSDVLRLLCLSAAFCLAELSTTTTRCCSVGLQTAYMFLSGTSVNQS